jgi:hypothetical protein
VLASLNGLQAELDARYKDLGEMERRAGELPHRTRYLRLLNNLARRTLDAQREWLDDVQRELAPPRD